MSFSKNAAEYSTQRCLGQIVALGDNKLGELLRGLDVELNAFEGGGAVWACFVKQRVLSQSSMMYMIQMTLRTAS